MTIGLTPGCGEGSGPNKSQRGEIRFIIEEFLSNPTENAVQLALMPAEEVELYVEYGDVGENPTQRTPLRTVAARTLVTFDLGGLLPDQGYVYRVHVRRPTTDEFVSRPKFPFRTLRRDRSALFRFAYAADSHITGRWVQARCGSPDHMLTVQNFVRTLENILATESDFVVGAGDNFMTHLRLLQPCGELAELGTGTVRTAEQADRRYEVALSPELWGLVARRLPFLTVLGNHDGEARFGDVDGSYGHFPDTRELSRRARMSHLPDPTKVYEGSEHGDLYYTFTSGDARFIILDLMSGPEDFPKTAADWTLGDKQLRWFEKVLKKNDRTWTFVFIEHLDGGVTNPDGKPLPYPGGPPGGYHYGRGGLRATRDRTLTSDFLGEQAVLQRLMRENGADVVFHAHDHVAVAGEKKGPDGAGEGVYYVLGGQAAGDEGGPIWENLSWFREQYDYDGNGEADFLSNVNGARRPGFYRVTVHASDRVDIAFVGSDVTDPTMDGKVLFEFTINSDGTSSLPF